MIKNNILLGNKIKIISLCISLFILFLDQLTKKIALKYLIYTQAYPVCSVISEKLNFGINWFLTFNYGTAFSFIKSAHSTVFFLLVIFSLLVTLALLYWLYKENFNHKLNIMAIGLIIGGALGNMYDRIILGYVVDFIDVYVGKWHWPVFNLADIAISLGVALLLFELVFDKNKDNNF